MQALLYAALIGTIERHMPVAARSAYRRDLETNLHLTPWAKLITATDPTKHGGFGLVGPWVRRGYTETETLALPAVALVALEHSRPHSHLTYRTYHVAVIHSNGHISNTDIETDSLTPGWAPRIMPAITELLQGIDDYDTTHRPIAGTLSRNRIQLKPEPSATIAPRFSAPRYCNDWR